MNNSKLNVCSNYDLSERELKILALMSLGYENREIADKIFVSTHTVKAHVSAIIRKLGAKNRTHAACQAIRIGICY